MSCKKDYSDGYAWSSSKGSLTPEHIDRVHINNTLYTTRHDYIGHAP